MRLIDADEMQEELKDMDFVLVNHNVEDWIDEQPTVDAVPVVRCKNCGAYQTRDVSFPRCRITGRMKGTDDYCSSGYTEDSE